MRRPTRKRPAERGGDYKVGYGRPPQATQFKPGKSGNNHGRPKGTSPIRGHPPSGRGLRHGQPISHFALPGGTRNASIKVGWRHHRSFGRKARQIRTTAVWG